MVPRFADHNLNVLLTDLFPDSHDSGLPRRDVGRCHLVGGTITAAATNRPAAVFVAALFFRRMTKMRLMEASDSAMLAIIVRIRFPSCDSVSREATVFAEFSSFFGMMRRFVDIV